jgi:hypothetical protein
VVFVEIDVKEIKDAVSERLDELDREFVRMRERGERFTVDFFLSNVASAVESAVRDVLKRYLGEGVACGKSLWLLEGQARLFVNCHVPGTDKRILVSMDPGFMTEIDLKLSDVVYWAPLNSGIQKSKCTS